jgi:hypothetical protein
MVFGNSGTHPHKKPMKIFTNALQTAPMSGSLPFPVDELPIRKVKSHGILDLNDPNTYRPRANGAHVDIILEQATCAEWMTKHRAPTFSFMKNIKRRYIVLVDRMLYAFKSESPDTYREFLELTKNTHAFVTDQFAGELFCIEIKKMGHDDASSWFLQADNAESMKLWLDRIKRTIAMIRAGHSSTITKDALTKVTTEEEEYSKIATKARHELYSSPTSSQSNISFEYVDQRENQSWPQSVNSSFIATIQPSSPISATNECESVSSAGFSSEYSMERNNSYTSNSSPRRQSSLRVTTRPNLTNYVISTVLPPQLPPPKSQPPPIPSYAYL